MQGQSKHIHIPLEFMRYAIRHKQKPALRLYCYLALNYSGKVKNTPQNLDRIKLDLEYKSRKSVTNNLGRLLSIGWITFSKEMGGFHIKGIDRIRKENSWIDRKSAAIWREDLKDFNRVIYSSIICREAQKSAQRERTLARPGTEQQQMGARSRKSPANAKLSGLLSSVVLGHYLKISHETAQKYKREAARNGYIKLKPNFEATGVPAKELETFKKFVTGNKVFIKIKGGQILIRHADRAIPLEKFSKRKKI